MSDPQPPISCPDGVIFAGAKGAGLVPQVTRQETWPDRFEPAAGWCPFNWGPESSSCDRESLAWHLIEAVAPGEGWSWAERYASRHIVKWPSFFELTAGDIRLQLEGLGWKVAA